MFIPWVSWKNFFVWFFKQLIAGKNFVGTEKVTYACSDFMFFFISSLVVENVTVLSTSSFYHMCLCCKNHPCICWMASKKIRSVCSVPFPLRLCQVLKICRFYWFLLMFFIYLCSGIKFWSQTVNIDTVLSSSIEICVLFMSAPGTGPTYCFRDGLFACAKFWNRLCVGIFWPLGCQVPAHRPLGGQVWAPLCASTWPPGGSGAST